MSDSQPAPASRAVFLSYASQDAGAAKRICESLRRAGVEVWFDQDALVGGDAWDQKIRAQVSACALFVPVISANTQERQEGYFRLEWHLAEQRSLLIAKGRPFIVPVSIDATGERGALVPEAFTAVQWTKLTGGETTAAFVTRVQKLLGGPSAPTANAAPVAPTSANVAPAVRTGLPHWVGFALGAVVLALIGFVVLRPGAKDNSPDAKSVADAKPSPVAVPAPVPVPDEKSIAVLPFLNRSVDKENEFFTDGIHEDILTNLAHIRELHVVSRTSVMDYRGTAKKIPQIARELNVAFILEGSVQRAGNKVRVTGQLIRAATDEHVWAENYDRDLSDVFTIQSELAQKIAAELKAVLSPEERQRLDRPPTANLPAYELYLKSRDPEKRAGAVGTWLEWREQLLQKAVALDPKFALAWVGLANVHSLSYSWFYDHSPERLTKAKHALDTAERLDPDAPEVLSEIGFFYYACLADFARGRSRFEQVVARLPNYANAWARLGYIARAEGRWVESLENLRKAYQLDRRQADFVREFANMLAFGRRYNEAEPLRRELTELLPKSMKETYELHRLAFLARGSTSEVDAWLDSLPSSLRESNDGVYVQREWAYLRGDAKEVIRLRTEGPQLGAARMALGETKEALAVFEAVRNDTQKLVAGQPDNLGALMYLGWVSGALGDQTAASDAASRMVELNPESRNAFQGIYVARDRAVVLAWSGQTQVAVSEIARLLQKPSGPNVFELRHSLDWLPLRGDPRFEALLNDPKNNAPLF